MNEQFLSPAELKITPAEFSGLVEFVKHGESLWHVDNPKTFKTPETFIEKPVAFNMDEILDPAPCGTVCCIGGYVSWIMHGTQDDAHGYVLNPKSKVSYGYSDVLADLYFPDLVGMPGDEGEDRQTDSITPAEAVAVTRHFLKTGEIDWTKMEEGK